MVNANRIAVVYRLLLNDITQLHRNCTCAEILFFVETKITAVPIHNV